MKASSLHDVWASPDNSRLTPKQFSFRLPIHVAAKIGALCEIYPQKSRTQIIADLLTSALDELEQNLPMALGDPIGGEQEYVERMVADHEQREYIQIYSVAGPRARFRWISNKHFEELEKELGNEKPEQLYSELYTTEAELRK
jgi:hypothetical protein